MVMLQVLSQMEVLYNSMCLSDEELERRSGVCSYLHSVLVPFFPSKSHSQLLSPSLACSQLSALRSPALLPQ